MGLWVSMSASVSMSACMYDYGYIIVYGFLRVVMGVSLNVRGVYKCL